MACLDTSAILDLASPVTGPSTTAARELLARLVRDGEGLSTTWFTVAELYVGVERSRDPERETARISAALQNLDILDFDRAGATTFAALKADLLKRGQPVGDMDILIGATAAAHGEGLVTRNPRDFERMRGVRVLSY